MGARPLRQHYDEALDFAIDPDLGSVAAPWQRHRARFTERLGELTEEQRATPTRCSEWDTQDVLSHLLTADAFWVMSLLGASRGEPTTMLSGFDPSSSPGELVDPMRQMSFAEVLERFAAGTATFVETVTGLDDEAWSSIGESPVGHVPATLVLAHAFWDSWLHERDIFEPLGLTTPVERDELAACAAYALAIGALEGGLIDDPHPVGPGLEHPIDATLVFDELPHDPLRVQVDRAVGITRGDRAEAVSAGSAVGLIETYTGRREIDAGAAPLPEPLAGQLGRARQVI